MRPVREADNLTTFACRMSWNLGSLNLLEPSGPHRTCFTFHKTTDRIIVLSLWILVLLDSKGEDIGFWAEMLPALSELSLRYTILIFYSLFIKSRNITSIRINSHAFRTLSSQHSTSHTTVDVTQCEVLTGLNNTPQYNTLAWVWF